MEAFSINGVVQATYRYDAMGQQVVRHLVQDGQVLHALHGPDGNRIAEYLYDPVSGGSTLLREYIWMDGRAVAVVEGGEVFFVRTDHIGRPVFATDPDGLKVWEASYLPFGGVHVSTGAINLRFPGQWFQSESGLHQNWMRDYDPTTGRYLQADPLGLVAGTSLYGYAFQSPLRYIDPTGEIPAIIVPMLAGAAVGMVAGYLQTGCVEGAAWGAAIGAGFGYAGAAIRAGAIASTYLGMANSAVSQIAAFEFVTGCECDNQTFNREVFLSTVLFAGLGNAAGARLAGGMGNRLAPAPGGDVLKGLVDGGLGALIGELLGARGPVVVRRVVQR
jgi:RHS repeat-associated protein